MNNHLKRFFKMFTRKKMSRLTKSIRNWIKNRVDHEFRKHGYIKKDDFIQPYIIKKNTEGVDFLLAITDSNARLWYDLYSTDPIWQEMRFIRDNLIVPGTTVLECGSHHGCTAILLSNWIGSDGIVYAFEPGKRNFKTLQENIELNRIHNIKPLNEVVGDENTSVNFTEFTSSSMGSMVAESHVNSRQDTTAATYQVKQIKLDQYLNEKPTLIKIDTQGYVYQSLLGAKSIIDELKPNLALELDSMNATNIYGDNFEKIFDLIKQPEYEYYVQFEVEPPEHIEFSDILSKWEAKNQFASEIHLFARNKNL